MQLLQEASVSVVSPKTRKHPVITGHRDKTRRNVMLTLILGAVIGLLVSRTSAGNFLYTLAAAKLKFLPRSKD
jgi:accessory gene regulator protein AgrB